MREIDGKYEILRQLGAGGMGSVFEARHRGTGRRVAIKVILEEARLEPSAVARFEREARAAGAIESEHITQVLDSGVDPATNAPYLAMELLGGEDLDTLLKRLGPLPSDLALRIGAQMLAGLQAAHEAGVIHRDIKPANVFLAKKPSGEIVVKICDFGIAKVALDPFAKGTQDAVLTQTSALIGSPMYMSPEQAKGAKNLDARADVWSAGVVLYQLLAGSTPHHEADTLGLLLLAICSEPAPPIQDRAPWVTSEISAVLRRALVLDADARFQSAKSMREALVALLPAGASLDASMLRPLSDDERGFIAVRVDADTELALGATIGVGSEPGNTRRDEAESTNVAALSGATLGAESSAPSERNAISGAGTNAVSAPGTRRGSAPVADTSGTNTSASANRRRAFAGIAVAGALVVAAIGTLSMRPKSGEKVPVTLVATAPSAEPSAFATVTASVVTPPPTPAESGTASGPTTTPSASSLAKLAPPAKSHSAGPPKLPPSASTAAAPSVVTPPPRPSAVPSTVSSSSPATTIYRDFH
jgi:serine/threonine-protein kinase